jgi:hypothetical protein
LEKGFYHDMSRSRVVSVSCIGSIYTDTSEQPQKLHAMLIQLPTPLTWLKMALTCDANNEGYPT